MKLKSNFSACFLSSLLFLSACVLWAYPRGESYPVTIFYDNEPVLPVRSGYAPPDHFLLEEEETLPDTAEGDTDATRYFPFPLNINTATQEELTYIPRVGEVISSRIVQYRDVLGGYTSLEQLMEIKGIGEATYLHLSGYLTLEKEE